MTMTIGICLRARIHNARRGRTVMLITAAANHLGRAPLICSCLRIVSNPAPNNKYRDGRLVQCAVLIVLREKSLFSNRASARVSD